MTIHTKTTQWIPENIRNWIYKRTIEIIGGGIIIIGCAMLAIIISANSSDATTNTATSNQSTQNWLGPIGAEIATHLIGAIGIIASFALAIAPIIWGARLIRYKTLTHIRWRLAVLPFATLAIAIAAAIWANIWLGGNHGWGGAAGGIISQSITQTIAPIIDEIKLPEAINFITANHIIAGISAIIAIVSFIYVAAIGKSEFSVLKITLKAIRYPFVLILTAIKKTITSNKQKNEKQQIKTPRRDPIISAGDETPPKVKKTKPPKAPQQQKLDFESGYSLPPYDSLEPPGQKIAEPSPQKIQEKADELERVLDEFGVRGNIINSRFGPVVTRYELSPAPGTKTQRVVALADDIARSMSALSVRVAVVPGQNVIGIELPNENRQTVFLRDIFDEKQWRDNKDHALPIALGMDIAGQPVITDLAKMPHLLVAGTTGSGKSVGINAMILSLLYTHTPETCRLIMIDPKMLELSVYDGIPHLLTPVVTDPGKAVTALKWTVREMENRYRNMAKLGVRNIAGYNQRLAQARKKGEDLSRRVQTGYDTETGKPIFEEQKLDLNPLPFITVIIDEVADLMLVAGKDIEAAVQRLAQMARAAGIHVVMATQRPSVDVITGTIKANFPTRISFQVTSKIDSRTILGEQGAEQLLGRGDMLYMEGGGRILRVHGPYVNEDEVEAVTNFLRQQGEPVYDDNVTAEAENDGGGDGDDNAPSDKDNSDNSLYEQAVELVTREGRASTSFIQRHLRIGYNRAATIIEEMEKKGVVSQANHAGKREVLINDQD